MAYFKRQQVIVKTFSDDLVPVRFRVRRRITTKADFQGPVRYALYSRQGAPLAVQITPGTIEFYRDRAMPQYRIVRRDGKLIATKRLPLDGQPHAITIPIREPGLYFLDFQDFSTGWRMEAAANRWMTIALSRSGEMTHKGHMQPMYFYVPRGTRRIDYYWLGEPHTVYDAKGKLFKQVTTTGKFIFLRVPPGMDGATWHFRRLTPGHLWFFNIPNYLAASPNTLLVPREVAQADRLKILPVIKANAKKKRRRVKSP